MPSVGYHKTYRLSDRNELVETFPLRVPEAGSVAAEVDRFRRLQRDLNKRLAALDFGREHATRPPEQAGIYPLKVSNFECSSEGDDADEMCRQLTARLGNLQIITEVPFMRKDNVVFAIRSQGLVDLDTGAAESVDALFGGGIYWHGVLTPERYDYELVMFRSGKDESIGRMTESIDLTHKLSDIDPGLYQSEVAYHLERESGDSKGVPTLGRVLQEYGGTDELAQVHACYAAASAFNAAALSGSGDLQRLAEEGHVACRLVPGKRYYHAYEAFLRGIVLPR